MKFISNLSVITKSPRALKLMPYDSFLAPGPQEESIQSSEMPSAKKYKDRVNTLLLLAILVATVAFSAAFSVTKVPGGETHWYKVFVVSNTIAMYSAVWRSGVDPQCLQGGTAASWHSSYFHVFCFSSWYVCSGGKPVVAFCVTPCIRRCLLGHDTAGCSFYLPLYFKSIPSQVCLALPFLASYAHCVE